MGKRGPSAQYAYGITIEAGNYNEVINGFEKRLKNLDKVTKTTTATFAALSEAMKSGKQVDFSKAEGQLTGLVAEMEEVAKWREQLAGGQKLSDMFDGLEQVKQSLGQVTGQLDKFGDNIEEIFSILQNVPQNTSKTFVDIRKVLSQTASDMNKIIAELNNPTEKTDVSGLKNQLSSLATDFVNEWNKAAAQGIKMDQVVDFKPFANIIKTAISGARSLGAEFNDVSASVTEATKNVVALYSVKHPTGMFKDLASELSSVENQSKNAERSASKTVATFKAAVSFVDKIKNSDLGIGKKSKELEDFLAKLQNPQITIKVNKDNVIEEFTALTSKIDEIVSGSVLDIDSNFLKSMSTDKLKELGDTLQNIVAIGGKYKNQLKYLDDLPLFVQTSFKEEMGGYSSDLKSVFAELESRLNEAKQSVQDLSNSLQQMVEKAGLKEIKVELGIKDDIDDYVNKINATITNIEKQSNRIKKIPVMLAFDNNDSDENKTAIETLKQNLGDLKKSIHDARTEINQDTKVIKQSILDALNVNAKDMVNVRAALEDAFNIEPLEILINDEFLVNQIQNALKNKTYDISLNANINGANYSGGGIPVSRVSSGGVPATQQSTAADKQEHASEGQSKAAEEQKSAAQTNDKSAQLLSKASQEMTAFVKKFANTYYRAKTQQKELDDKVASGGELNETERRRLSRANGSIRNLTPIKEYLQSLFGDKVDLSKITEEAMSKVLTSLMQSNGKGSFKGELLSEDLLGLLTGLKGKYRSKYGNGIGDLLSQLVGTGGKNGTLDTMFKSFGLSSATFTQTSARDYTAPDVLKYYQSFARLADIIDEIKIHPQNVSNELLTELSNILKGMQNRTTSEEYRANITEIGRSINALAANIKDYNAKVTATADLDTKEGEDYTPLLNMFKELYSKVDEATKATISSAIGVNPSEDIIKGDQLVKAREALSTISGDEASSKIASDLLRWLDRMIASDNVVLSRETLLSQLGKGQRGSGLKVATSKNGKGKMTAYGIANNVLSDLDADIYYDGMGNPIVINRKDSPTQKRKSLRMVKNLGASGRRFANGTQIYNKDNPRPKIEDERRPESSIKGTVDWGKRLAAIDAELAKTSSEYETAIKKRDESIKQIEQKEREISKQIDIARKNVEDAKGNLSNISQGTDMLDSGDINNIKSAIRDREKLYNLMAEMDKSYIPDFELSKRNVPVSDTYKQLIEERKSVRDKLSNYKKIASGQIVPTEYDSKVAEQENILANLNAQINDELDSQKQQMDKDTYSLLLKIVEQYKERQSKLKGLEKDLSKYKEGSKEHDKILVQIDSLKTNLNSMIDEISQIGATLGLDNKDLENAFSGMSSDEFFSSKDARKKLEKEVENLSKFKKDSLADVSIFPDELKDLVQKRNELLSEKSDISHNKEQLKELRNGLKSAKKKGDQQSIEYYEERIKMISERVKEARPTKEINSEIKEIDKVIIQYIKDKISELKKISKTRFSESTLAKYEIDGTTFSRYKKDVSDKSSILSQLEQEARILAQNKEVANSDVISLENKRKILEKQRELAQLQVDYNTKRMEELQLTEEIASLEKSDSSSEVLAQKRQQLAAVNAELSDMYKQIHASGSTTSYETLDESISADQKKLIALEKIIEAQKIIAQNEEMQNRARAKIKDSTSVSNIKHDSETGKFTTQYGNESKLTRYTTDRFKSIYTQSDDFTQFRNTLYEKAREKISEFQISTGDRITEIVDGMYQDALSSLVKKNFGKRGVAAHEKAFTSAILEEDELLKKAIDARILELETAEKAALEEIWSHKRKNEFDDGWSDETIEAEVERVTNLYNTKKSSILNGADFTELLHSRTSQFLNLYHKHFRELIMEEFGDEADTKTLQSNLSKTKESAKLMLKGSIRMSEGNGEDSPLTPFGKRVTEIFNQNEAKIKEYIDVVYRDLDEKLQESIDAYMKEISSDETRLEGELASDVVFKDKFGNRINLAAEYRNANQYNLDRVTTLGQENKAQKEWIARLREYGGISDEEMKYIQEAKERALLKIYGGSESEIRNLDILIGDVDTAPIEEATTSIANQTIKAAAEVAKKAAADKFSTPTVTSAEYKDAVKIVKEAIGSFRGRTDKSKAEFYGTLGKEVKDAANLIYRTPAENRTKEGNALLDKMIWLKNATQEKQKQTAEEIKQTTEKQKQTTEEVKQTAEQQKQVELSNAEKLKLAKKELQKRLDAAKNIQDGTTLKSNKVIVTHSDESKKGVKYSLDENIESIDEFAEGVWKLTEAFKAGADAANIEYGFATQNGKRIQLAKGDNDSVDFTRFHGDIDSLTHSHSYTKGVNNMVFSLADIDQLETLGTRNNLKRYNLIYDNEMMSLNLGKNSQEAAEAIADCYPQINDVVMAMLSREDGNSIPAENTEEMARILNGYLQKVVEDAGGRLSVVNSKGENVTSKYSITDDEYNKFNNVLAKLQSYYDNNFGSVSKSDYVSVIRQYLSEEFGKEFMANITSKSNANPHGGLYTEFSAIPEYDDEDKKMLDYAEQVTLYSKKNVAAEKAFVESLQKMSNEDLMSFINQAEETLGVKKEPEVKPTLTKAQIAALNPDDVTALQKASIKQFSKVRNWNENNVGNIEGFLGADNKTLVAYKTQFEELAKIALDLKAKGESGTIITKDDISQLDIAISKTKELQTALTKEAQFKQMKDAGLIVSGKTKIKSTDSYSERQDIMAQYAKKYAAQNKSEYQFGQYDFINDKIFFNMIDSAGQVTKVIMGWSEAFNSAYIQSSKLQGSLDKITQEVYKTDEAIKAGEEYGFFQEQSEGVKAYKDALAEYEAQVKAVAKSSQKDLAQNFEVLHTAQEKVINAGKDLLDKQKDAYGFNNAQKVLGRTGDVDAVLQNYRDQGINVNDIELVRNYNDAMGDLNKKIEELKKNGKLWDANEQPGLKLLADRAIEAEKALLKADEAQRQLNGEVIKGKNAKFFEGVDPNNVDQVKQAMEQYARSINGVDAQSIKWSEDQKTLSYSVRTGKHEVSDFTIGVKELTNEFYEARTGTRAVKTGMEEFLSSVGSKFKEVGRYLLSFGSFYRVWGEIQKGVTYVREIDSALTELKKVTDETDETYAQFLKTMSQTGADVGATVKDLTNMAANWARLGYSIQEAGELAKSTAVLLNVSEFESADEASEALISTIQAYGYAAEDSMHVVDVLNEIGNNFAISSDGIATALQDSASSLMAAGNNLEQSVAMIAAANKVLQDPNSVGAALRTISLRIRGTSVKVLEEMGEETDGVIESVSKLQAKVKGLSGVDILTDTGAYKDTYTIIKEIAQVWDQMNDINRAALLELLAGKNRSNAMAALLTNIEDLEGAYEDAMAAQGSAEAENEKYMNSIQGRIDQFTNALQTMWKNAIDSNFVKFIVSVGTGLVKVVNWLGMIPTILGTISGAMSAIKGQNLFVNLTGKGKSGVITELIQKIKEGIPAIREFNSIQGVDNQAKFLNSLKETNPELSNYITKVMSASAVTTENGVATNIASVSQKRYIGSLVAAKVASIGLKVATVALNAALTIGISLLISGAISAISKVINGVKEAKEETKRLTEELKQQQAEIKSNISSLESLKDEFDKLSKGVDEYGNNISLSTEEYAKYKSIVEQILGYTPTLISGYDKEGNAIANKNSLIEKSIELLKEERKQKLLELVTDDKLKVAYDSAKEDHDKAKERLKNVNVPSTLAYSGVKMDDNGKEYSGYVNQIDKYIEDVIGVEKSASESLIEYIARNSDAVRKNIGKIIERSGQTKDGWKGLNDKQQTELLNYLNNVLSGVRETDAAWDSFIQTLQLVPQISAYYDKLSDSQKSFISSYINGLGDLSNKTEAEINNIKTSILSLTNAIGSDKEAQYLIDQLFSIDSNLSAKEYSDKISEIFNKLVEKGTISNDDKQKFIDQLFPDLKDIETMQTKVKEKVKDGQKDLVNSLNAQDLKIAYSIDVSNVSFDELKKSIQDVKVANIGDFNISDYSDSISSLSENIGVLQAALEKLNSGQFTMDDYVKLIKDFPKLAKGVDVSSKSFKGLTSNLVRAIKASPKSMVKDLKALKLQLMQTGRATSDIDQLIYSLEHMPEDALDSMITKYSTLADTITEATEAQNELKAAMEENPNEGFETRGEAMDYMKEAMSRGEIGSGSNLWNVAEKYGFTFDSAKSINENADALAKFIATREKWFKQDDDGNYTYEGTEDFIKKVDAAVASMSELQELMKWDYNESTGVLDFDFKNKDWDQIVKYLSTCEGLIGLTSDEWADMLVQVGQYFNIDWSNYNDELEYLKKITTEDTDNKTKVEKYGSAMQEYFGKDSSIDLANRPMVSSSKMKAKGWDVEDGSYATVFSGAYSNEGETAAIVVTPILPDGEVLTEEELTKYATEIVNGADPAAYEFEVNGKTYTGEDIILAKHNGKDPIEEAKEYGQALHEAQEEYDKLRDTLNINTTIDEKGIEGLSEIKEIQSAIQKNADGTTIIDEQAFRKALTSAEYTEDQVNLIIDKIKSLNSEVFASDTFNLNKIFTTVSTTPVIDQLLEIQELQGAIKKDAKTGLAVIDTDMFTSVLSEAGYTKTQIDELIQKIQEYENVVSVAGNTDPLGLSSANLSIDTLKASLSTLGVFFEDTLGDWFDGKRDLVINVPDLVSTLKEKGWTEEAIRSYCEQLSKTNIEGFNIKVNSQEIDEALAKSDDVPEEKTTNYEVTGNGATTLDGIENTWSNVTKDKTTNYTINETTVKKTVDDSPKWYKPWTWFADGTANAQGNWGAERTERSLVGELGPELRVRGSRWEMLGENGAEFTDVKKGDIIFNHKQTEELLKNGHITGRGRAYANGTAYAAGGGTFARYGFSGNGGYTKYDVNNSIVDSFGNAADSISDAADKFEEVFDWFEVLLEEIEDNISLMNAKLENAVGISAKKGIYSEIINTEQFKLQELYEGIKLYSDYSNRLLAKVPDQYKEMAKNGAVAITDFLGEANQEVVDSINNYREWAKKVTDLNQQLEETKKTIADTHVEIQNMLKDEYDNRISLITSVNDRIQDTIDLLDEEGKRSSAVMYEEMIKNSTKQLSELQSKRAEMQRALDEAVRSGDVARESTQWYEMVNAINDVDSEINDCRIDLEGFQNSINQLHWDNFEKFIDAIDNVGNEISNLGDLIDEEDVVDEVGNWTDKGITALGLYAQEMERAKYRAEQYGKEIEYLNQEYAAGKYSVDEYNEKLQELKDGQWDSIKSYEAAKKSIIDLNKTRIEAIKDGIQKEIDAYSELIDKKKEELSLQKDAHDFSKQVAEQQKNIANIQKQLAAMAGDNSASAIARRKQLEAELAAAQEELDELYYNHSVEKQQEALDKSLENYQDDKQNEMDALDESLKNEEQIIADSYATITANTESVAQTLSDIASQYGITLSDSVMQPWLDGANAIGTYQEQLDTSMSSFTQQLEALKQMYADLQNQADSAGRSMVDAINGNKSKTEGATYTPPTPSQPSTPSKPSKPSAPSTGSSVTVKKSVTRFSRDGGNGTRMQSWVPGSTFTVYQVSGSEVLIGRNGQYTGWVRLSDIEGYAKGAKKIQNNQLAMLDELGDELVLHAGKNGRLEYLTKGTSVVPADITSNLMKLGSLDPNDILERNRPSIGAPHVIDNSIELKMEFGSLVHVDTVSNDTLPYLQKMVRNEFDNCMKHVNQGLKKFVR